jgi:hypothetical protein
MVLQPSRDLVVIIQSSIIKLKVVKHLAAGDSMILSVARIALCRQRSNTSARNSPIIYLHCVLERIKSNHIMKHERFDGILRCRPD